MTGFYLCFTILSVFGAIIHPRAVLLRNSTTVSINFSDDLAIFGRSHLSLDSVTSMRSLLNVQPIRPIMPSVRKPQSNSFLSQVRASVLKQVQLYKPIPVLVTERKPSNHSWNSQLDHSPSNEGLQSLSYEESLRSGDSFCSEGRRRPTYDFISGSKPYGSSAPNKNIVSLRRVNINKPPTPSTLPSVYMHNIRSINNDKFTELKSLAVNYDLIMLTESWLTEAKEHLYTIDGYTSHTSNRAKRTGGGVAIYVSDRYPAHKLYDYKGRYISSYWLLLQQPNQPPIIFANVYHPPGLSKSQKDTTVNHIVSTSSKCLSKHPSAKLFICGDFNDLDTAMLTTLFPVQQIVDFNTRGDSKLDLVFTNIYEYIDMGCVCRPPILTNDHCAIEIPSTSRSSPSKYITVQKRTVTPTAKVAISQELSSHNWSSFYEEKSIDAKVEILQNSLSRLFDKHCPVKTAMVL